MKIVVPIKRVVDHNVRVPIKADGSGVDTAFVKMSINPFDEIAVEEALRLREAGIATEVVVVTCGVEASQEVLRTALAMGGDRAILVESDVELQPLAVSKLLKEIVEQESPQLVLMGKQAIDNDAGQTGQMLAGLLGWAQATYASKVKVVDEMVVVTREIDGGAETVQCQLPAIVTADLRLNTPRIVGLMDIMKAKSKSLVVLQAKALQVGDVEPRLKILEVVEPPKRREGVQVADVSELIGKLRDEAKVI